MSENQEHQIQPDEHQGGLEQTEHTTQAARQDLQAQPEQTPRRHDGGKKQVGRGWSPWGMTLVN
jgi:hypothetical protein